MVDTSIAITYRLQPSDYEAMMDRYWRLTKARRVRVGVMKIATVVLALATAWLWWRINRGASIGLAAFFLATPAIAPMINRWSYRRIFRRQRLDQSEISLGADDRGFTVRTATSEGRLDWAAVRHADVTPDHVFLWQNPYIAYIVPRAAFPSSEDAAAFVNLVRDKTVGQTL